MIRLLASDIDGTLMRDGEYSIPPALFPLIRELRARGIYFAACSGRQYSNIRHLFAPVADDIGYICENGSLVIWQDEILSKETIDRAIGQTLLRKILAQPDSEALLSGVHTCYVQPKDPTYVTPLCQAHDKKIFIFSCPHDPAFLIGILPPPVSVRRQKKHEVVPFLPAAYSQKLCCLFCNKTQSA